MEEAIGNNNVAIVPHKCEENYNATGYQQTPQTNSKWFIASENNYSQQNHCD